MSPKDKTATALGGVIKPHEASIRFECFPSWSTHRKMNAWCGDRFSPGWIAAARLFRRGAYRDQGGGLFLTGTAAARHGVARKR